MSGRRLFAVASDGLDGAAFHGFLAKSFFLGSLRLFENVAVTTIVIALEVGGRGLAAQIAINALIVHVKFATDVLGILVCYICHRDFLLDAGNYGPTAGLQSFFRWERP